MLILHLFDFLYFLSSRVFIFLHKHLCNLFLNEFLNLWWFFLNFLLNDHLYDFRLLLLNVTDLIVILPLNLIYSLIKLWQPHILTLYSVLNLSLQTIQVHSDLLDFLLTMSNSWLLLFSLIDDCHYLIGNVLFEGLQFCFEASLTVFGVFDCQFDRTIVSFKLIFNKNSHLVHLFYLIRWHVIWGTNANSMRWRVSSCIRYKLLLWLKLFE